MDEFDALTAKVEHLKRLVTEPTRKDILNLSVRMLLENKKMMKDPKRAISNMIRIDGFTLDEIKAEMLKEAADLRKRAAKLEALAADV